MEYVNLTEKYAVPQIGFGVFMLNPKDCREAVRKALANGYRHIDTAQVYGNEGAVGQAIRDSGIPREEIFLTSKVSPSNYGYEKTKASLDQSLELLGTDYIDLMLLHQPFFNYMDAWNAMGEYADRGVLRTLGVSNFSVEELKPFAGSKWKPVVNQVECHPLYQRTELKAYLDANGIAMEAWYPLGHGSSKILEHPVFTGLGQKYGKTPAQVILRWHLQQGRIIFPKAGSDRHQKENLDLFGFTLTEEEMASIAALDRNKSLFRMPKAIDKLMFRLRR